MLRPGTRVTVVEVGFANVPETDAGVVDHKLVQRLRVVASEGRTGWSAPASRVRAAADRPRARRMSHFVDRFQTLRPMDYLFAICTKLRAPVSRATTRA